jgi:hypothetical protein
MHYAHARWMRSHACEPGEHAHLDAEGTNCGSIGFKDSFIGVHTMAQVHPGEGQACWDTTCLRGLSSAAILAAAQAKPSQPCVLLRYGLTLTSAELRRSQNAIKIQG